MNDNYNSIKDDIQNLTYEDKTSDPFYSKTNIAHLRKSIEHLNNGKGKMHDIIEVENIDNKMLFEFTAIKEDDNSYTLDMKDFDIVVNGDTFENALDLLIDDFKEYCLEYYQEFDFYHSAPNRKKHLQYILKALTFNSNEELKKDFIQTNY